MRVTVYRSICFHAAGTCLPLKAAKPRRASVRGAGARDGRNWLVPSPLRASPACGGSDGPLPRANGPGEGLPIAPAAACERNERQARPYVARCGFAALNLCRMRRSHLSETIRTVNSYRCAASAGTPFQARGRERTVEHGRPLRDPASTSRVVSASRP